MKAEENNPSWSERSVEQDQAWSRYYAKARPETRDILLQAVECFDADASQCLAVDCACGTGRDSAYLLSEGFEVYAFDRQPEAIDLTTRQIPSELRERLSLDCVGFEEVRIPECHLFHASLSLFFARPDVFKRLWAQVCERLVSGGMLSAHFLGDRDEWVKAGELLTSHSREELYADLEDFEVIHLREREELGPQSTGKDKHWHIFDVVARKK
ncbi:MAG: tellurite methyltransferase [Planctomycetota bacterium]|jgi:tellurite methyltransferase